PRRRARRLAAAPPILLPGGPAIPQLSVVGVERFGNPWVVQADLEAGHDLRRAAGALQDDQHGAAPAHPEADGSGRTHPLSSRRRDAAAMDRGQAARLYAVGSRPPTASRTIAA